MPRFSLFFAALLASSSALAAVPVPAAPPVNAASYVLMDFHTGRILAAKNDTTPRSPASTTKLMTAYVVFKELEAGQIHMDDKVHISEHAWRTGGSRMFVKVGTKVPLKDLLQGMIVQSGNDATVALAEGVATNACRYSPRTRAWPVRSPPTWTHARPAGRRSRRSPATAAGP